MPETARFLRSLTVTAEIGPPVAVTLTVVLGATEAAPLAGVIFRLPARSTGREPDEDDEDEEDDEPPAAGLALGLELWQPLASSTAADGRGRDPAGAARFESRRQGVTSHECSFGTGSSTGLISLKTRDSPQGLRACV